MANKKGEEQMINRQRKRETKEKESGIVKNVNYAERERASVGESKSPPTHKELCVVICSTDRCVL